MRWDIFAEKLMGMNDDVWMRHANPWSGLTRFAATPLIFLAVWSYVWIGWWSVVPIALAAFWSWINPRMFPKPQSTNNWMSKGVFGERVFINRHKTPIPRHHAIAGQVTTGFSALFMLFAVYGFIAANFWAAFLGFHACVLGKLWFVDRMVWLYEDMKEVTPEYKNWLYDLASEAQ